MCVCVCVWVCVCVSSFGCLGFGLRSPAEGCGGRVLGI